MSTVIEIPTPNGPYHEEHHVRNTFKDAILEYIGTFAFVYISLAGVNQAVLTNQSQLHIAICFALGLSSGIILAGKSGGHLNPAVTLTVYATTKDFGFTKLIAYIVAQLCGGFSAGLLVLAVYWSWINNYENEDMFIGTFGTLQNENNSLFAAIVDQFIGSALLMFGIMATPSSWSKPITVGAILGGLGLFQGSNGFSFNMSRDFSPRLASLIVFGSDVFTAQDYWFWVPIVIPFFGVPFGAKMAHLVKLLWE